MSDEGAHLAAHALHADAGRWVTNEKGLVRGVARLPRVPEDFDRRAGAALGAAGTTPGSLAVAVEAVALLLSETEQLLGATS